MRHREVSKNDRKRVGMLGMKLKSCASQLEQYSTQACCRDRQSADPVECRSVSPVNAGDQKSAHKAAAIMLRLHRRLCK